MFSILVKCDYVFFLFLSFRMFDDFGHELEMTDSKLQQTVLKVEKVLRLSDGKLELFLDRKVD